MGLKILSSSTVLPKLAVPSLGFDATGIRELRYAEPHQYTSDLVADSIRQMNISKIKNLKTLIVATTSGDSISPATAHRAAAKLFLDDQTLCFDVTSSCTSFLSAIVAVRGVLEKEQEAIVSAAEVKHRQIDSGNLRLKNLFGDGASSVLVKNSEKKDEFIEKIYVKTRTDLVENIQVILDNEKSENRLVMTEPRRMYREILREMHDGILECWSRRDAKLRQMGLDPNKTPGFIYVHQANAKLLEDLRLRLPTELQRRMPILMSDIGNTVSASLPILRTRSLLLVARELGLPINNVLEKNISVLSTKIFGEQLLVSDFSGCDNQKLWINQLSEVQKSFFENYIRFFSDMCDARRCDIWLGAGGGFQTVGLLHCY